MYTPRFIYMAVLLSALAACSSNSSDPPDANQPGSGNVPDDGGTDGDTDGSPGGDDGYNPTAGAPTVTSSREAFGSTTEVPFDGLPYKLSPDGDRLLLRGAFNAGVGRNFTVFDTADASVETLLVDPVADPYPAFSADWSSVAYAGDCNLWFQRLDSLSEPVSLSSLLPQVSCPSMESVQLSDDGETVLFDTSFTKGAFGQIVFRVTEGSSIDLSAGAFVLDDSELAGRTNTVSKATLSADGRYVVAILMSTDETLVEGQVANYVAGTLLIDTSTGENQLINRRAYSRFVCGRCNLFPLRGPEISGNGRYVFFQQPLAESFGEEFEETGIYRYDIESKETILVADGIYNGGFGTSSTPGSDLVVSDDGERVALITEFDDVRVFYLNSGDSVSLKEAFRFCTETGDACLFDSLRFTTSEPLEMSGDGSGLTIFLILQRDDITTPQNQNETLHFDLETGVVSRVAPLDSGSFTAISKDGDSVALLIEDGNERVVIVHQDGS